MQYVNQVPGYSDPIAPCITQSMFATRHSCDVVKCGVRMMIAGLLGISRDDIELDGILERIHGEV